MAIQPGPLTRSYTYHTELPEECANQQPCLLGVDEAGRGPALGKILRVYCYSTRLMPVNRTHGL
jgi:hypothetical protein